MLRQCGTPPVSCVPLTESLHTAVQKKLNLSDGQWADMVKQMTGHPSKEDMEKAKAFAKEVLAD